MKQETKVKVYQSLYGELKTQSDIKNLGYPEKKTNYDFYFDINGMHVDFSLMAAADLFRMETSRRFPGYTDGQLEEICGRMAHRQGIRISFFNEQIILRSTHPLTGKADAAAETEIRDSVFDFIQFIRDNRDVLRVSGVPEPEEVSGKVPEQAAGPDPVADPEQAAETVKTVEVSEARTEKPDATDVTADGTDSPKNPPEEETDREPAADREAEAVKDTDREESRHPAADTGGSRAERPDVQEEASDVPAAAPVDAEKNDDPSRDYALPVAEQMRLMYADMDRVFENRKKQMDYREDTLNRKESVVQAKLSEISRRQEELKAQLEQWDLKESEYNQRVKALDIREETLQAREKDLDDRSDFIELMEKEAFQEDAGALQIELQKLRTEKEECEKELEETKAKLKSVETEKLAQEKQTADATGEAQNCRMEAVQLKKDLEEIKRMREGEQLRIRDLTDANASMQQELETLSAKASKNEPEKVKEYLNQYGFTNIQESGSRITAEKEGVSYCIRPDISMVRAEKEVRKGAKYRNLLSDWNQEQDAGVFLAYDKLIFCQASYADLGDKLEYLSGRFRQI